MKKVLLIGGSGYIGSRLSKYLAENGYEVFVLCRSIPKNNSWKSLISGFIVGDITKNEVFDKLLDKKFDIAIHLVSLNNQDSEGDPDYVSSVNVLPTWNILRLLTKNGLKKFIYFSTIHVYGTLPNTIINEDFVTAPQNTYGLTHLLSENICNYFNATTKTDCINVRLSNGYGSPAFNYIDCWSLVLNDFCKTAYQKEKIIINSDGSPLRDFIHWYDIEKALALIIKYGKHNIYHMASGETVSILELANKVKDVYYSRYNKQVCISLSEQINKSKIKEKEKYALSIKRLNDIGFKKAKGIDFGINEIFDYMENLST